MSVKTLSKIMRPLVIFTTICFFFSLGLDFVEGIILGFIVGTVIVRIFAKMCFRSLKKDQAVTLDFIRTETNVHEADIQAEAEIGWSGKIYLSITLLNQTLQEQTGMGSRQGFENHVDILHDIELQGETLWGDRHPPSYASHLAGNKITRKYIYDPDSGAWRRP